LAGDEQHRRLASRDHLLRIGRIGRVPPDDDTWSERGRGVEAGVHVSVGLEAGVERHAQQAVLARSAADDGEVDKVRRERDAIFDNPDLPPVPGHVHPTRFTRRLGQDDRVEEATNGLQREPYLCRGGTGQGRCGGDRQESAHDHSSGADSGDLYSAWGLSVAAAWVSVAVAREGALGS
jgi:hypothetical protein